MPVVAVCGTPSLSIMLISSATHAVSAFVGDEKGMDFLPETG